MAPHLLRRAAAPVVVPGERLELTTSDGQRLAATHLEGPSLDLGIVVAHGFSGAITRPALQAIGRRLSTYAGVLMFDFRGHGESSGVSTLGDEEIHDLEAAVAAARGLGYAKVATCGWSMGGSVVLRHAAEYADVDAVVSVSATSRWFVRDTVAMRRLHWLVEVPLGRWIARRFMGVRIRNYGWDPVPEPPVEAIARIAPTPVLIVHGDRDSYFTLEHPRALHAAAGEGADLWVVEGFGHAENSASPELVDRIAAAILEMVGLGAAPTPVDTADRASGPTADPPGSGP